MSIRAPSLLLLAATLCGLVAGCGWDTVARTAAGLGEAWCRHAERCYPACDADTDRGPDGPVSGTRQDCRQPP